MWWRTSRVWSSRMSRLTARRGRLVHVTGDFMTLRTVAAAGAMTFLAIAISLVNAQPPAGGGSGRGGRGGFGGGGGRGGGIAPSIFTALDTDKDGSLTRAELKGSFDSWLTAADKSGT